MSKTIVEELEELIAEYTSKSEKESKMLLIGARGITKITAQLHQTGTSDYGRKLVGIDGYKKMDNTLNMLWDGLKRDFLYKDYNIDEKEILLKTVDNLTFGLSLCHRSIAILQMS